MKILLLYLTLFILLILRLITTFDIWMFITHHLMSNNHLIGFIIFLHYKQISLNFTCRVLSIYCIIKSYFIELLVFLISLTLTLILSMNFLIIWWCSGLNSLIIIGWFLLLQISCFRFYLYNISFCHFVLCFCKSWYNLLIFWSNSICKLIKISFWLIEHLKKFLLFFIIFWWVCWHKTCTYILIPCISFRLKLFS